ncbi:membrane protein [Atopobacter phocae]|uniref:membrane protein n=1 Tax=Atopobacter phocae TaxID=136492 RepID=UPI0004729E28|nr:membrane protein [Atopobacter phocae]
MKSIILAELYKLLKRKNFIVLAVLSLWSLIYGFGAFLHWDFVKFGAKLDLVTFTTTMWTFLLILTIPLLLILYTSSSILGGEIQGGQILLEVNRVASKKTLIISKYIVVILSILFLYILNGLSSIISYIFFLSKTEFGYTRFWELHSTNVQSIIISLVNLGFVLLLASIAFYLSLHLSAIVAAFASLGIYFLCQLLSYMAIISKFIPGYFFTVPNYHFTVGLALFHLLTYGLICMLLLGATIRVFEKKSL